ncbi:FAD-binding domain-containing protein [Nioella nitratireducens]|uniref:FAD-binding domain-containing protein n=1 Tax=Nioella nitratireducens TaxID=1287720 RepID=UPI0008FD58AE|nr:FAD-binding domain-containing protein [Nioella nitratireducens]
MITILWFKRDLRVEDNPALAAAAAGEGPVLPLYIVEPEYWALPDSSARQWRFVAESLLGLAEDLARLGAPLAVRMGDAVEVLEGLRTTHGAMRLVSHEETGNLWTFARDGRVTDWARGQGVEWLELPQPGITRGLSHRRGWAGRRDKAMRMAQADAPKALAPHGVAPGETPDAQDLRLRFDPCPERQKGGRTRGLDLMQSFLEMRASGYLRGMSSPVTGAAACSRLSPHLAFGTLSPREVVQSLDCRRREEGAPKRALSAFSSRVAWRDHFMQKLESAPQMETHCLHPAYEALRPRAPDAERLEAWKQGETGLPFVDACMRQLIHTGWINFRMRAMLMAVASYHLWLDWRVTGLHLARLFTDYEPGIHWPQAQMQSGVTGMNTPRIYNPVKQGLDQDPDGAFVRKWVPELRPVPNAHLHAPWDWGGAGRLLGHGYPAPIVDPMKAARAARTRVWGVRDAPGFREDREALLARHAAGRPKPLRKPRKIPTQLSFEI